MKQVQAMSVEERATRAIELSFKYMPSHLAAQVSALFTPEAIAMVAGSLALLGAAHFFGVGLVVDFIILSIGLVALGWSVWTAADLLVVFVKGVSDARTEQDLERAAKAFAEFVTLVGVSALSAWLLKRGVKRTARPSTYGGTGNAASQLQRLNLRPATDDMIRAQVSELPAQQFAGSTRFAPGMSILEAADKNLIGFRNAATRRPGWFDVAVHGTEPGEVGSFILFLGKQRYTVTPEQLASLIRDSGWKPSQGIRLYTCRAAIPGVNGKPPAQELAQLLRTDVIASNKANVNWKGGFKAFPIGDKATPVEYVHYTAGNQTKLLLSPEEIATGGL